MQIKIERNDDGFLASCPSIEGTFAEGDTELEALYNLLDVVRMIGDYRNEKQKTTGKQSLNFSIPIAV